MDLGLACHVCGTLNALGARTCSRCAAVLAPPGHDVRAPSGPAMTVVAPGRSANASGATVVASSSHQLPATDNSPSPPTGGPPGGYHVAPAPSSHTAPATGNHPLLRFDPATGESFLPDQLPSAKTMYFGALQQQPIIPRLVVIKGEGGDGATYHLQGTTTVIGRQQGDITFLEDPFLSPEHARFTGQHGRLFVQDLGSENGVFLRIKKPTLVRDSTSMLVGEQLLRLRVNPFTDGSPIANGTYYYGSPRPNGGFQVVQCLAGGGEGRVATAEQGTLSMGREGNTLNFPDDRFISGHHARLDAQPDSDEIMLTDTGSRNGTFIRLDGAQELFHGDYLFVGQQLLRVEIA